MKYIFLNIFVSIQLEVRDQLPPTFNCKVSTNCVAFYLFLAVSHFTFMREMQNLSRSIHGLRITLNKVYNCVCPIVEKQQDNDEDRGLPALPVDSFDGMAKWENFLKDHDNSLNVVSIILQWRAINLHTFSMFCSAAI